MAASLLLLINLRRKLASHKKLHSFDNTKHKQLMRFMYFSMLLKIFFIPT